MSFLSIVDSILFKPLQLIFEVIYVAAYKLIRNPGLAIIALSLVMNFLILPLYMRADAIQEEEKQIEKKLRPGVSHIKKTFKGDERMMMLQAYYKLNGYKQTYVLRSAVSLLLEIPFFIAAYRFLSGLEMLQGVSFGPIADLGKADGLLTIGGISINILPVIMTVVNLISCVIFTKDSPLKTKIQLYGMALFFLFFLYSSPSGLVFYWTLNNIFSLVKTVFYKLKHPGKVLAVLSAICGLAAAGCGLFFISGAGAFKKAAIIAGGLALTIPLLASYIRRPKPDSIEPKPDKKLFITAALFLSILTGVTIPASVIKASPQEFLTTNPFHHPLWYIAGSFCVALGIFMLWTGVFYKLMKPRAKVVIETFFLILCGVFIVNYMFFGRDLGLISADLKFDYGPVFSRKERLFNIAAIAAAAAIIFFLARRFKKHAVKAVAVLCAALIVMAPIDFVRINKSVSAVIDRATDEQSDQKITLSGKGKNVVVIMLDRSIGVYLPYIFNEKPELKEKFSGFTVYTNTISYGANTNSGAPALFGGYEYTPEEINKRDDERLVDKHNEALKVMPALFSGNGYDVTVIDAPFANYNWKTDVSVFDGMPGVTAYAMEEKFIPIELNEYSIGNNMRNFFCYSIMKSAPIFLQTRLYDEGMYYKSSSDFSYEQFTPDSLHATGKNKLFMTAYNEIVNLPKLTKISENDSPTFTSMTSNITHEPMLLQEPEYEPSETVDNTAYEAEHKDRFTIDGKTLLVDSIDRARHYQINAAALIKLGEWFDYLKQNGVYDNTRFIIAADHGRWLTQREDLTIPDVIDAEALLPTLLFKDFGETEFKYSNEFMTNADVPTLATAGLIEDAANPFTGKKIDSSPKSEPIQYVFYSNDWNIEENNGNTFPPGMWLEIKNADAYDIGNWSLNGAHSTLPDRSK